MKIKDIVSLQGCCSVHDVGEQEVKLTLDEEKVENILANRWFSSSADEEIIDWDNKTVNFKEFARTLVSHADEIIKKGE